MPAIRRSSVARPWSSVVACLVILVPSLSPARAQVGTVRSLDGEWIRTDSNYDPNDTMRIRIGAGNATLISVPSTVSGGFRVGGTIWQGIQSNGAARILGSDGQYYTGTLKIEGTDILRLQVHHMGPGHQQTWKRAGPPIEGEWVRVAIGDKPADGTRIVVAADQASIRYLPPTAPRSMRVGSSIWRDIRASGSVEVLGTDGRYQPARITLVGSAPQLRLVGRSLAGSELWVRPGDVAAAQDSLATLAPAPAPVDPNSPGGQGLFHFLRADSMSHTTLGLFGTNGVAADVAGLAHTVVAWSHGKGYGGDHVFVIRTDSARRFSTLATLTGTGVLHDRFGVGSNFTDLTYVDADIGYGPSLFYTIRDSSGFSMFGTVSTSGAVYDRFGVGRNFVALTFVGADIAYGPNLFYYLRLDPQSGATMLGTISLSGAVIDRFGVGTNLVALEFVAEDIGYGPNLFYFLRRDAQSGATMFGTISLSGAVTDRFGVGSNIMALLRAPRP